jgi:tripartite-type tricarboxylate transporter receptor subunit TctC
MNRRLCLATAASLALPLLGTPAHAQPDYPSKPLTLVVGYPPGGSTDLMARILAAEMGKRLGQTVIIDNSAGAGGVLAAQKVAAATPDGYTLILGSNNEMAISKLITASLRYDAQRDFTPIGLVATQPMVLVASPQSQVKTLDEFIARVKRQPGKLNYGSSGNGTALHLAGEMIKQSAELFMVHIPYRGAAPLTSDLIGGQLDFAVLVLSSALPHIRSGKIVALGLTEARRSSSAPEIAALSEHPALRKVNIGVWFGLFGPARLPDAVATKLRTAYNEAMQSPELRRKLEEAGARAATLGDVAPDKLLSTYQKAETDKYSRVVDFAKIKE